MARSTIKGTVTTAITLGAGAYHERLVIDAGGLVLPAQYGATAITDPVEVSNAHITNHGRIYGGSGNPSGYPYGGGAGIAFDAVGTLLNTGSIRGGGGGYGGVGGIGVDLPVGGDVTNRGEIRGGGGGANFGDYDGGPGAAGIVLNGGMLTNSGGVYGGIGGGRGADYYPGAGAAALIASGEATIKNSGTLAGGFGEYGYRNGASGGAGVQLTGAMLTNSGTIIGGAGGGDDDRRGYGHAGNGGAGVQLDGGTLVNTGTVIGGAGGGAPSTSYPGYGGAGVMVTAGTLVTGGTITGGYSQSGYHAGAGVDLAGSQSPKFARANGGENSSGATIYAVSFGSGDGTLIVDPGAVFNGQVTGNSWDTMILAGTSPATITGVGYQFTDFGTFQIAADASWVLNGSNGLSADFSVQDAGTLSVMGTLIESGTIALSSNAILNTGTSGTILATEIQLNGARLTTTPSGTMAIGNTLSGANTGTLLVEKHGGVEGYGTISADAISVAGALVASGGTLTLHGGTTGSGIVRIDADATIVADGTLSAASVDFAGTGAALVLAQPADVASTLANFGSGDLVDLRKLVANTFTYAGGTMTLLHGSETLDTLIFAGNYTQADFALASDGNGGTDISYASFVKFIQQSSDAAAVAGLWHASSNAEPIFGWSGLTVGVV